MRPDVPELMGVTEVAQHLGFDRRNINAVVGLPAPLRPAPGGKELMAGRVWLAQDIYDFGDIRAARRAARKAKQEEAASAS